MIDAVTHSYVWYKNVIGDNLTTSSVSPSDTEKKIFGWLKLRPVTAIKMVLRASECHD